MIASSMRIFGDSHFYGVYFRGPRPIESPLENRFVFVRLTGGAWVTTTEGCEIREWLDGNVTGQYTVSDSHVLFEDHDDALMCYLRFKGDS